MAGTTQVVFKVLNDGDSFVIDATVFQAYACSWLVDGGSLSITSSASLGNGVASDVATFTTGQFGSIPAKSGQYPLDGLTFAASGGTTTIMLYL